MNNLTDDERKALEIMLDINAWSEWPEEQPLSLRDCVFTAIKKVLAVHLPPGHCCFCEKEVKEGEGYLVNGDRSCGCHNVS